VEQKPVRERLAGIPDFTKTDDAKIMAAYPPGREPRKGKHGRLRI